MYVYDYCHNSIFFTSLEHEFINKELNYFFSEINQFFSAYPIPVNVYLGGTLALKEPSLKIVNGVPDSLMSDVDMFVFYEDIENVAKLSHLKSEISTHIKTNLSYSFHCLPVAALQLKINTTSALSVWEGRNDPIWEAFKVPEIFQPQITSDQLLFTFIGRLARLVLQVDVSTHLGDEYLIALDESQRKYILLKMLIAGLHVYQCDVPSIYIADIHTAAKNNAYIDLLDWEKIEAILMQREFYDPQQAAPQIDLYQFVVKILARRSKTKNSDLCTLLEVIYKDHPDSLYHLIGALLVAYSLFSLNSSLEQEALFKECLSKVVHLSKKIKCDDSLEAELVTLQSEPRIQTPKIKHSMEKLLFLLLKSATNQAGVGVK